MSIHRSTLLTTLLAASVAALITLACWIHAATNIVSEPAGFVRMDLGSNDWIIASMPFDPFDADINAVLGGQMSGSTNQAATDRLAKWLPDTQSYTNAYVAGGTGDSAKDGYWFSTFTNWVTSTLSFYPGEGFWLKNHLSTTQTVFLCGSVVLDATNSVWLVPGKTLFGYPFTGGRAAGP